LVDSAFGLSYFRRTTLYVAVAKCRVAADAPPASRVRSTVTKEFRMKKLFKKFVSQSDGQDLIEYALLASVIALGVTAAMMYLRAQLNTEFSNIGNSITAGS
jgi:Flp pilus assembly pilin Flp